MYVLVTDDEMYRKVDLEALATDFRTMADNPEAELPVLGYGIQVFGPYETYEEGKRAAITMPYDCDYWVVPLKRDVSEARIPDSDYQHR